MIKKKRQEKPLYQYSRKEKIIIRKKNKTIANIQMQLVKMISPNCHLLKKAKAKKPHIPFKRHAYYSPASYRLPIQFSSPALSSRCLK